MKLDNVTLSLYKYRIKTCQLIIGSGKDAMKHTVDEERVESFEVLNNYDDWYFPFFTMTLMLPNKAYRTLIRKENTSKVSMKLNIQRGVFDDAVELDTHKSREFKDAINGSFRVVIGAKEQDLNSEMQESVEEDSNNEYGQMSKITVSLYPKSYFANHDTVINAILQKVSLMDVMVYCFNKAKITNMLVSPPDNNKKYEEFKIVPIPLNQQLRRICNLYAFHEKGSIIYFDLTRGYVINKVPECTAYEKGENKLTYLAFSTKSASTTQTGGGYENRQKNYYLLNGLAIATEDDSEVAKKISGNNVVIIDKDGNVKKTNKKATKVTNVVLQSDGESTTKDIKRAIKETKNGFLMAFRDIDIMALSPNKQFIVSIEGTEYKSYNGKCRLKTCNHVFTRDGNYFTVTTTATFTK